MEFKERKNQLRNARTLTLHGVAEIFRVSNWTMGKLIKDTSKEVLDKETGKVIRLLDVEMGTGSDNPTYLSENDVEILANYKWAVRVLKRVYGSVITRRGWQEGVYDGVANKLRIAHIEGRYDGRYQGEVGERTRKRQSLKAKEFWSSFNAEERRVVMNGRFGEDRRERTRLWWAKMDEEEKEERIAKLHEGRRQHREKFTS